MNFEICKLAGNSKINFFFHFSSSNESSLSSSSDIVPPVAPRYVMLFLAGNSKLIFFHYSLSTESSLSSSSEMVPSRNLRRKRCAIGSMEDLWDETIFEEFHIPPTANVDEKTTSKKLKRGGHAKSAEKMHDFHSGDIVWASSGKDDFWWPAKVIAAPSSNGSSCLEVMLLNRSDEEPIKISGSNLIRPFMEMIRVMRLPPTH